METRTTNDPIIRAYAALARVNAGLGPADLSPAEKLDISIMRAGDKDPWKVASVKTDYGSIIDFTIMSSEETAAILSEPSFIESIVEKYWSQHPGGVCLPCKRKRDWTDAEAERLTIWKIAKRAEKVREAA